MSEQVQWSAALVKKYDGNGPRYTSYPTALCFEQVTQAQYLSALSQAGRSYEPLSLYVHIPFCRHLCYYCACNKHVTKQQDLADKYIEHLAIEMSRLADFCGARPIKQLHFGGGTPTFLTVEQMQRVWALLDYNFDLFSLPDHEFSIEIDPRVTDENYLAMLKELGFNRISIGVQDFNPATQKAVHRVQPYELVAQRMQAARDLGFHGISIDLIYGLPNQSEATFEQTLRQVLDLSPDRIAMYSYAHLPDRFAPQKRIDSHEVPTPETKLAILGNSIQQLQSAGMVYIGMDHFAKPDDPLAQALYGQSLQRNFQGYSTHKGLDMLAMGVSSISFIDGQYFQNEKSLDAWQNKIAAGEMPVAKGYELNDDDIRRRWIISRLSCAMPISYSEYRKEFGRNFLADFKDVQPYLQNFADDGLIKLSAKGIDVLPTGRLLLRPICMLFDAYLTDQLRQRYSRIV
ncbi:oxygen-independent coproporphyrinogen III oxidase [Salinibius halmophilus]|uniref:oxygen-independent coproporphyrinogen III oxidase n=1 Tax=Salinibius halmophilus TaxID=1853216 RepID=UPI000E66C7C8|nr:oxygen-independent coproporphyrinogen III oxidase [Salinibius halmophilus]